MSPFKDWDSFEKHVRSEFADRKFIPASETTMPAVNDLLAAFHAAYPALYPRQRYVPDTPYVDTKLLQKEAEEWSDNIVRNYLLAGIPTVVACLAIPFILHFKGLGFVWLQGVCLVIMILLVGFGMFGYLFDLPGRLFTRRLRFLWERSGLRWD